MPLTESNQIADFQARAEALLPAEREVVPRNRAITAAYARFFKQRRELFKWAGMASFASHRVGISLIPFAIESWAEGGARFVLPPEHQGRAASIHDDLNLLRLTNNRVYESIAWAHLATSELNDDAARVLDLCGGVPEWKMLRKGWDLIGQASRRLKQGEPVSAVQSLIWRGNQELLRFEQEVTVQSGFERMNGLFTTFMTWAMSMEFDGDNERVELDTFSYFPLYMWTSAFHVLVRTRSLPRVSRFDHRWTWVEGRLLPLWMNVDASDRELEKKLERLIALGEKHDDPLVRRRLVRRFRG